MKPTIETIREKYKNVKEVRCLADGKKYDISNFHLSKEYEKEDAFFVFKESKKIQLNSDTWRRYCVIWEKDKGYAEIISYKEETLPIKKTTLLQLAENNSFSEEIIKKEFPQLFESELEDNTWYTFLDGGIQFNIKDGKGYGICTYKEWVDNCEWIKYEHNGKFRKSTEQEVFEALKNEAVKRGFKEGVVCNNSNIHKSKVNDSILKYNYIEFKNNKLNMHDNKSKWYTIFKDGEWATLIDQPKEITISEIEKILGYKILIKE